MCFSGGWSRGNAACYAHALFDIHHGHESQAPYAYAHDSNTNTPTGQRDPKVSRIRWQSREPRAARHQPGLTGGDSAGGQGRQTVGGATGLLQREDPASRKGCFKHA